jgi:truncated hemoglobin YjbI
MIMNQEIETLKKLAGLKEHWHDKLKVALGEEEPQTPEITKTSHRHWLDKLKSAANAEWYDKATEEMIQRIQAGEFEMEVVNDLARQYASMNGGSHDAFQFAVDALGRRAWQMGLNDANDNSKPRYQIQPQDSHREPLAEYHMDHMQNPGRRSSEKCLNLHRQAQQDDAYGRVAKGQLEDEMKTHGFDNLDLFLKTCERVVNQDESLRDELSPKKAQEALMLWRKNKIFELMNFVEGYGFKSVQDLLNYIKTIKEKNLNESHSDEEIAAMSREERIKEAAATLSEVWSDDEFRGTWAQAVSAIARQYKISSDELLAEYDRITFPGKGKKRDPNPQTVEQVINKWNEYKEKHFNKENLWRWEELNKIAQDHGYWNLTDFLKRVAKLSDKKIIGIKESSYKTVEPTTKTALAYLKDYNKWVEDPDSMPPKEKGEHGFCMHRTMRAHGYRDPNAFAQACKQKLAQSKNTKIQKNAMEEEFASAVNEVGDIRPNLIMSGEYGPRKGLEGPFTMKNGQVVYYDAKEGKYWDPKTDMYIPNEEIHKMHEMMESKSDMTSLATLRDILESFEEEQHQNNIYGSRDFSSNVKDFYNHVREFPHMLTGDKEAWRKHDVVVTIRHPYGHTEVRHGSTADIHRWMPETEVKRYGQNFANYELSLDPPYPMNEKHISKIQEAEVVPMHSKPASGMEVPKGYASFYVQEISPTVSKIIGVKPNGVEVEISRTSTEGAHALAKHYNSGGRGGVQSVSLMSAFGTPVMQELDANGYHMMEKPGYFQEVVNDKKYHVPVSAIRKLEQKMNMKIPVKPMKDAVKQFRDGNFYPQGDRISDLETVILIHPGEKNKWGEETIKPGSVFLADRGGAKKYYRAWALIPDYSATVLNLKK